VCDWLPVADGPGVCADQSGERVRRGFCAGALHTRINESGTLPLSSPPIFEAGCAERSCHRSGNEYTDVPGIGRLRMRATRRMCSDDDTAER